MITILSGNTGAPLNTDDYYVKQLESGLDELCIQLSIWDPGYPTITEETQLLERSPASAGCTPNVYTVKAIDGGGGMATIKAVLNLEEWKQTCLLNYKPGPSTAAAIVNAVKPAGWTVYDYSGLTATADIDLPGATPLDVLLEVENQITGAAFRFDNLNKTVTILNAYGGQDIGAFATRELNLKEIDYKGKSTGFATRLYAQGKDGLTVSDINGGLPYVDNHQYSDAIICAYWDAPEYEVAENLLEAMQAKLDELSTPQRSFECDIADLAAIDPLKYSSMQFVLFSIVRLFYETRPDNPTRQRVVARWIYPEMPERNKVTFANTAPRIQVQVQRALAPVTASRLARGSVGGGALAAGVNADIKDGKDALGIANTAAANAAQALVDADKGIKDSKAAKDTADTANNTANTANSKIDNMIYNLQRSSDFDDFKSKEHG